METNDGDIERSLIRRIEKTSPLLQCLISAQRERVYPAAKPAVINHKLSPCIVVKSFCEYKDNSGKLTDNLGNIIIPVSVQSFRKCVFPLTHWGCSVGHRTYRGCRLDRRPSWGRHGSRLKIQHRRCLVFDICNQARHIFLTPAMLLFLSTY